MDVIRCAESFREQTIESNHGKGRKDKFQIFYDAPKFFSTFNFPSSRSEKESALAQSALDLLPEHAEIDPSTTKEEKNQRPLFYPWTPEEDQALLNVISTGRCKDWPRIALSMPGRTGKQCWQRFRNHLKSNFRTGDWTPEEDAVIRRQQALLGNRWSKIAQLLPGRSENAVKNRWHCSLRPTRLRIGRAAAGPPADVSGSCTAPAFGHKLPEADGGGDPKPRLPQSTYDSFPADIAWPAAARTSPAVPPPSRPAPRPQPYPANAGQGPGASALRLHLPTSHPAVKAPPTALQPAAATREQEELDVCA